MSVRQRVKEVFRRKLGRDIPENVPMTSLPEIDSLTQLEMIFLVENEFGVAMDNTIAIRLLSVDEIVKHLENTHA
jgi:acyl carrier protein